MCPGCAFWGAGMTIGARPRGTDHAEVIQVVKTEALVGQGTHGDPCRMLTQYWALDGELLASYDPRPTQPNGDQETDSP